MSILPLMKVLVTTIPLDSKMSLLQPSLEDTAKLSHSCEMQKKKGGLVYPIQQILHIKYNKLNLFTVKIQ